MCLPQNADNVFLQFGCCSAADEAGINMVVREASKLIGLELPSSKDL